MDGRIRVLHVDDDPGFRELTETALEETDGRFHVETAASAAEGLDRLSEGQFDCIVSDYEMPDRDGVSFLEAVRADHPDIPFVLFTGKGDEAVASEAVSAGVTDYLQKGTGMGQYDLLANRVTNAVSQFRAEQRADETNRRLRELTEAIDDVVWLADGEFGELVFVNSACESVLGIGPDEYAADPERLVERIHPDDREAFATAVARMTDGEHVASEYRLTVDGEQRWIWTKGQPVIEDGSVVRIAGIARDVTDRKRREQALRALYEMSREVMDTADRTVIAERAVETVKSALDMPINGFWLYDDERDALVPEAVTDEARDLVGEIPTFDGEGSLVWDTFEANSVRVYDDLSEAAELYNDETPIRSEIVLPLGDHGVMTAGATEPQAFDDVDLSLVSLLAENVETALDRAARERELSATKERLEAFLDSAADVLGVVGEDGTVHYSNAATEWILGYEPADLVGENIFEYFHPDDREEMVAEFAEMVNAPEPERRRVEYRFRTGDGSYRWLESVGSNRSHDVLDGYVVTTRDITQRKRQAERLERQNERLEEFTSIVGHDLRNPLEVAQARLDITRREYDDEHLERVARSHDRMEQLISDLLTLARTGSRDQSLEPIDLAAAVRGCWGTVETGDATLTVETDCTVRANQRQLQQLLANLVRNAIRHGTAGTDSHARQDTEHGSASRQSHAHQDTADAGPGGEDVRITVGELGPADVERAEETGEGEADTDMRGFYVADDGPGIPPEEREKIFESGYSTARGNTGLGLAIVREVVEAHDWTVTVTDSETGGARFEFTDVEFVTE